VQRLRYAKRNKFLTLASFCSRIGAPQWAGAGTRERELRQSMKATAFSSFLARIDTADYRICKRLNRGAASPLMRRVFQLISRLGDGILWYALILALPLLYGAQALRPAIAMALTGAAAVALYGALKHLFVRERPFIKHASIWRAGAPLDRYSFPSGHTLHAVSFAWQASVHFPQLSWTLLPLAGLIGASRIVLGLHYPTDVIAGALIGAALAQLGLALS
jgi:undecaprenyl-diphosphatase